MEPDILLLDEPTNHLDAEGRSLLVGALRRFRGVGVIVSHATYIAPRRSASRSRIGGARKAAGARIKSKNDHDGRSMSRKTLGGPDAVVKTLLELNDFNDLPATTPLLPLLATLIPLKVNEAAPPGVSSILLANFAEVKTMHDLRAWLWQQVWAIGNRSSIVS